MGRMYTPTLYAQKFKDIIIHLRKAKKVFIYMLTWHSKKLYFVSIFCNFITQPFITTILWFYFVKFSAELVKYSLAKPKWFQDKIQIKMNFSI